MTVFWDTSALLSVVLNDRRSREAEELLSREDLSHVTSAFTSLEAENRLRAMEFEGVIGPTDGRRFAAILERLFATPLIPIRNVRESRLIAAEGRRMIRHFSAMRPHKTMDVIHVSCARLLKSEAFFTFDSNQAALAEAAGFRVSFP